MVTTSRRARGPAGERGPRGLSFVALDRMDVQTATTSATSYGNPAHLIWIRPEGTTRSRVLGSPPGWPGPALDHCFNLATRISVLATAGRIAVG